MRKPDFFLVGAPRCATTSMVACLGEHPQIFVPFRKDTHFFGSDLTKHARNPWFILDESKYLSLFELVRDDQTVGDVSVMYLYSKRAAAEIKAFNSRAKILIQLRNPIDMMYSHHGQHLLAVSEDMEDFQEALALEPDRRRGRRIPRYALMPEALFYRETARYAEQVCRYFEQFGRENVHVVIYDDIQRDLAKMYAGVLQFLGVDPTFQPPFQSLNRYRKVRSRFLQGLVMKPPVPLRALLSLVPDRPRCAMLLKLAYWNSVEASRPPLSPELRHRLCWELADEVDRLSKLLDRDLSHWVAP